MPRRSLVAATMACVGLLAASCSSTGGSAGLTTVSDSSVTPEMFLAQGYCPPVQIRPGTESIRVYERGHDGEAAFVRYQGSISTTARECHVLGPSTLSIKVGIAGRVTAGPKGGPGSVALPIRVAVVKQNGGNVFYSQAVNAAGAISPPQLSSEFAHVVENVTVQLGPDDRDLIVYVGFDEGPPRT